MILWRKHKHVDPRWRTMTARKDSFCIECKGNIYAGNKICYNYGLQRPLHFACHTARVDRGRDD